MLLGRGVEGRKSEQHKRCREINVFTGRTHYNKALELPASGNSRDQNKKISHSSGNQQKLW